MKHALTIGRRSDVLNQTAEYALRAVLHLAESYPGTPTRVADIADALDVPHNYLSKVLHVLAREGILESSRGPSGGFWLARPPEKLLLAHVISPFDPIEDRCLLMRRRCSDLTPCIAHHQWKDVALKLRGFFRETSVADIVGAARADGRSPIAVVRAAGPLPPDGA
jgi:Rrf2 family protein